MPASSDSPPEPAQRAYHPSPFIRGSVALHVAAAGALIARPGLWPWALAAVLANHLALTAAGLWPRAALLGPNYTRLPAGAVARGEIAITIDDGPDPDVTPAVLALLDKHDARSSFFCVGAHIARYPQLAREIVARGHSVENHTQHHLHRFSLLGPRAMRSEVVGAQESIGFATGVVPRFFRAPAGLRNPFLEPQLARAGLTLVSWTRRGFDTVATSPEPVLRRLTQRLTAGDILLLHDGHAARTAGGTPLILEVLPRLLAAVRAAGLKPVTLRAAWA
ncbi:MAG TPA: polysaccharide deacetylase family protein [Steroidobacteraceae bacterium]|jgi:peptidoglycan/xylan/chitin deacetylase (PgdA/CDA1 family)|nr:polysaccharide deacetylase family protein [Steroidobacteraceae bacterium]